ncbi:MAG: hypothetical protein MJY44_04570 [Bacteroidales bacterium]|nr:hypothetical protein [Bacteroidales bacterium]
MSLRSIAACILMTLPLKMAGASSYSWVADSLRSLELLNVTVRDPHHAVATVRIGFNNPGGAFEISEVKAGCLVDGVEIFRASTLNLIAVGKKCDATYLTDVEIVIPEESNFFNILNVLKIRYRARLELDASIRIGLRGGLGARISRRIPLEGIFAPERLATSFIGRGFSLVAGAGTFKINHFDVLYVDEAGPDGFRALLEIGLEAPPLMKVVPEMGIGGMMRLSGHDAFLIESENKLDIKSGDRMYYVPVRGRMAEGFNPCLLLNLLKSDSDETLSIVFSKPAIASGVQALLFDAGHN